MWRTHTSSKISRKDVADVLEQDAAASSALPPRQSATEGQDMGMDTHLASAAAAIYDGTGTRVKHPRNEDSVISLYSNEEFDASASNSVLIEDDSDSLSDDIDRDSNDSSELTALASRPRYTVDSGDTAAVAAAAPPDFADSSVEDMVTPGLHTAGMASLHFGHQFSSSCNNSNTAYKSTTSASRPSSSSCRSSAPHSPGAPPMTLASYLSSTLSSPKTRSVSSGSLASFPTDFLSDISRAESLADTDDAASEFNSDADPASSTSQLPPRSRRTRYEDHMRDSSDLVMPKLGAPSNPDSHSGSSPSDSDKATHSSALPDSRRPTRGKSSASSNATLTAGTSSFPRILMVGGTNKQQAKLRAALLRANETLDGEDAALASSSIYERQAKVECVGSLAAAGERAERPFTVLQTILRPEIPTTDAALLENLLPNLLDQVAAVSVCLLILDVQESKTLAQHVLEQFQRIYELAKFTALVPILVQSEDATGRDSVSQLTQGNIDWLGRGRDGTLASLKAKARPYHIGELDGLALALAGYDFNASTVKSFQRWNSPVMVFPDHSRSSRGRQSGRQVRTEASSDRHGSNSDTSEIVTTQSQSPSQEPGSLASSMLESVTLPPLSSRSGCSASSEESKRSVRSVPSTIGQRTRKSQQCHRDNLDPLHLPSLLKLVGLNLAASFTSVAYTIKAVFRPTGASEDDEEIRKLLEEDRARSGHDRTKPLPATLKPFYGCGRWRYSTDGEQYHQDDKNKCQRCGGIIFAGLVIGIALWFS